jgi:hypothetical protein
MSDMMTLKDKEKFERLWKKLSEKFPEDMQGEHCSPITNYLQWRIARLEKLVYFLIEALAGEGWYTMELRETAKRLGIFDLIEEGIKQ